MNSFFWQVLLNRSLKTFKLFTQNNRLGFPAGWVVKNLPASTEDEFDPWVGKIPWRRKWQPTPVLPGESQGQSSLVGCSPRGCKSQTWLKSRAHTYARTLKLVKWSSQDSNPNIFLLIPVCRHYQMVPRWVESIAPSWELLLQFMFSMSFRSRVAGPTVIRNLDSDGDYRLVLCRGCILVHATQQYLRVFSFLANRTGYQKLFLPPHGGFHSRFLTADLCLGS